MRWWFLALVALFLLASCTSRTPAPTPQTVAVTRGDLEVTMAASGNLTLPHQARLSFGVVGTIKELNAEVGDRVAAGKVLARLDTSDLERALVQAEASVRAAELALNQTQNPTMPRS